MSFSLLALIVLAGLLVAGSARQQGEFSVDSEFSIDWSSELLILMEEASSACDSAVINPYVSDCAEALWLACDEASAFRLEAREAFNWGEATTLDEHVELDAKALAHQFLCPVAHMAELGELAASLAGRYTDEFFEEKVGTDELGDPIFGDFWRFREHMTYTPWSAYSIYGSDTTKNGPGIVDKGIERNFGRWLSRVQDWGRDDFGIEGYSYPIAMSEVEEILERSDQYIFTFYRLNVKKISRNSLRVLNSVLGSVSKFTSIYDSWPIDKMPDPLDEENIRIFDDEYFHGSSGLSMPSRPYDETLGVFSICSSAIADAKTNTQGWEEAAEHCEESSLDCRSISLETDHWCDRVMKLLQFEYKWQKLPEICAKVGQRQFKESLCYQAILAVCDSTIRPALGTFATHRYRAIKYAACQLTEPLNYKFDIEHHIQRLRDLNNITPIP